MASTSFELRSIDLARPAEPPFGTLSIPVPHSFTLANLREDLTLGSAVKIGYPSLVGSWTTQFQRVVRLAKRDDIIPLFKGWRVGRCGFVAGHC